MQKRYGNPKLARRGFFSEVSIRGFSGMNADIIRIERPSTNSKLFAHTRWDIVPVAAGLFHLAYFLGLYFLFPHAIGTASQRVWAKSLEFVLGRSIAIASVFTCKNLDWEHSPKKPCLASCKVPIGLCADPARDTTKRLEKCAR